MKRILAAMLIGALGVSTAIAQDTAREEDLTFDTRSSVNLTVNQKAYSAIQFNGTITDSVDNVAIDITGKTGSMGFKSSLSSSAFFAQVAITITDGSNGLFTATIPSAQWATNIVAKKRFYGDVRLSDFGNVLPSIDLWLYPSANHGTETTYVAPTSAGFETNGVLMELLNRINFGSGFGFSHTIAGSTNKLTLSVSSSGGGTSWGPTQAQHTVQIAGLADTQGQHAAKIDAGLFPTQIIHTAQIESNLLAIAGLFPTQIQHTVQLAGLADTQGQHAAKIDLGLFPTQIIHTAQIESNLLAVAGLFPTQIEHTAQIDLGLFPTQIIHTAAIALKADDNVVLKKDGSVDRTANQNYGGFAPTNAGFYGVTIDATNYFHLIYNVASNRPAIQWTVGASNYVTFLGPAVFD